MKYSEAEKRIKALSSKYDINIEFGNFNVMYNGYRHAAFVSCMNEYVMVIDHIRAFSGMPFCKKLYMILAELAITPLNERVEEKKYYVKIFDGDLGYLNIKILRDKMNVDGKLETDAIKTKFTDKEIEKLKQRDDIPLDWNKVKFEEADD